MLGHLKGEVVRSHVHPHSAGIDTGATCSPSHSSFLLTSQCAEQSLLGDPNNDSPLNSFAATLWDDQVQYKETLHKKYSEHPTTTEQKTA